MGLGLVDEHVVFFCFFLFFFFFVFFFFFCWKQDRWSEEGRIGLSLWKIKLLKFLANKSSNCNKIWTNNYLVCKQTLNHSAKLVTIKPVWINDWVFIYELSDCGFESHCCHLNFRYWTCFEQGVPWHSASRGV